MRRNIHSAARSSKRDFSAVRAWPVIASDAHRGARRHPSRMTRLTRMRREATMPEGDTLYRVAHTLQRALAGQVVRRFDSAYAPLLRIDEESPICGRTVLRVEAR